MTTSKRAIELRRRSAPVPANRVTVLDPHPRVEIPPHDAPPTIYVHVEHMHVTQPAAPAPQIVERVIVQRPRPRKRRRGRRRMSPGVRAVVMPIAVLLLAIAAVYIAHAVLADPVAFTDHVRTVGR